MLNRVVSRYDSFVANHQRTKGALVYFIVLMPQVLSVFITGLIPVSYTHLTLPTTARRCRSRWSPYH